MKTRAQLFFEELKERLYFGRLGIHTSFRTYNSMNIRKVLRLAVLSKQIQ